jgi:hypothetical protein
MKNRVEEIMWEDGKRYCDVDVDFSECECDELEGNLCHCERHYVIGELLFNGGPCVVFKDILNLTCIVGSYSIVCICCTHDFHD